MKSIEGFFLTPLAPVAIGNLIYNKGWFVVYEPILGWCQVSTREKTTIQPIVNFKGEIVPKFPKANQFFVGYRYESESDLDFRSRTQNRILTIRDHFTKENKTEVMVEVVKEKFPPPTTDKLDKMAEKFKKHADKVAIESALKLGVDPETGEKVKPIKPKKRKKK